MSEAGRLRTLIASVGARAGEVRRGFGETYVGLCVADASSPQL
jgi:hypothetical protein